MAGIATVALALAAVQVAPVERLGVGCVAAMVLPAEFQQMSKAFAAETMSPDQVAERLRPAIRLCIESKEFGAQAQIDISYTYTLAVMDLMALGAELTAAGIDPDRIDKLWSSMPAALRSRCIEYAKQTITLASLRPELEAYVRQNPDLVNKKMVAQAMLSLLGIARARAAEQAFEAAG